MYQSILFIEKALIKWHVSILIINNSISEKLVGIASIFIEDSSNYSEDYPKERRIERSTQFTQIYVVNVQLFTTIRTSN